MTLYGKIVVIKRNGADGANFPLTATACLFGRSNDCDIRIQLPSVDLEHCRVDVNKKGEVFVSNLSSSTPTILNGRTVTGIAQLGHKDIFTITDRSFRFEFPPNSPHRTPVKSRTPTKSAFNGSGDFTKILSPKAKPPSPRKSTETGKVLTPRVNNTPEKSKSPASVKKNQTNSPKQKTPKSPKRSSGSLSLLTATPIALNNLLSQVINKKTPKASRTLPASKGTPKATPTTNVKTSPTGKHVAPSPRSTKKKFPYIKAASTITEAQSTESTPRQQTPNSAAKARVAPPSPRRVAPKTGTPKETPKHRQKTTSPSPRRSTPEAPTSKVTPKQKTPRATSPSPRRSTPEAPTSKVTPKQKTPRAMSLSPRRSTPEAPTSKVTPKQKTPRATSPSPRRSTPEAPTSKVTPKQKTPKATSPSPRRSTPEAPTSKVTPKQKTPRAMSLSPRRSTPEAPTSKVTPKQKTPKATSPIPRRSTPEAPTSKVTPKPKTPRAMSLSPRRCTPEAAVSKDSPKQKTPKATSPSPRRPTSEKTASKVTPKQKTPKATSPSPRRASPKASPSPRKASLSPRRARPKASPSSRRASPKASPSPRKASPGPRRASPKTFLGSRSTTPKASPKQENLRAQPAQEGASKRTPSKSPQRGTPKQKTKSRSRSTTPKSSRKGTPKQRTTTSDSREENSRWSTSGLWTEEPSLNFTPKGKTQSPKGHTPSPKRSPKAQTPRQLIDSMDSPAGPETTLEKITMVGRGSNSGRKSGSGRKSLPPVSPRTPAVQQLKPGLNALRRRSEPVIEVEEPPSTPKPAPKKLMAKVSSGKKRKSTEHIGPSAKRKRVSFGPALSPEHFNKHLPPDTPIRRGATPNRLSVPEVVLDSPRPLLKRRSMAASFMSRSPIKEESPQKLAGRKTSPRGRTPSPKAKTPSPKAKTPSPRAKTPSPRAKTPSPRAKTPSPRAKTPSPRAKTPSPRAKTPSPRAMTPSPRAKTPSPRAKIPSPRTKTSSPRGKTPSPRTKTTSPRAKAPTPRLKTPSPSTKAAPQKASNNIGAGDAGLEGLTRLMKTPKNKRTSVLDASFTGIADLMASPAQLQPRGKTASSPRRSNATPASHKYSGKRNSRSMGSSVEIAVFSVEMSASPELPKIIRGSATPNSDKSKKSTPKSTPRRKSGTPRKANTPKALPYGKSPVDKIVSPPSDFNKVVALRAIHGKSTTPKLPATLKTSASKSARKTPKAPKMLWSDIVKKKAPYSVSTGFSKKKAQKQQSAVKKMTKTRRATPVLQKSKTATPGRRSRQTVYTTGHVNSPATIYIHKKKVQTPSALSKRGRKSVGKGSKCKSVGSRVSLGGVKDLFDSPVIASPSSSQLFDELPNSPDGPGEMFVSPIVNSKTNSPGAGSSRKSANFVGVKELFTKHVTKSDSSLFGVRETLHSPKIISSPKFKGVREMTKTPKGQTRSPTLKGVREMMTTTSRKQASPRLGGIVNLVKSPKQISAASLTGVKELMKTPKHGRRSLNTSGVAELFASPQTAQTPDSVKKVRGKKAVIVLTPGSIKSTPKSASKVKSHAVKSTPKSASKVRSPAVKSTPKSASKVKSHAVKSTPKSASQVKPPVVQEVSPVAQQSTSPKTTRSRRGKAIAKKVTPKKTLKTLHGKRKLSEEDVTPQPSKAAKLKSVPSPQKGQLKGKKSPVSPVKSTRGRRAQKTKVEQEVIDLIASPVVKATRGRKRAAPAASPVSLKKAKTSEATQESIEVNEATPKATRVKKGTNTSTPSVVKTPTPKKGRTTRGRKAAPRPKLKSPTPTKRGRPVKGKPTGEEKDTTVKKVVTPKKKAVTKMAVTALKSKKVTPRKTRRKALAALDSLPEENLQNEKSPTIITKRGRKISKASPKKAAPKRGQRNLPQSDETVSPAKKAKVATPQKATPVKSNSGKISKKGSARKTRSEKAAPIKKVATPIQKVATPIKKVATPIRKVATPLKKDATPVKKYATPVKKAATPVKKASKKVKAATPAKKATTSATKAKSDTKGSNKNSRKTPKITPKKASTRGGRRKIASSPQEVNSKATHIVAKAKNNTRGRLTKVADKSETLNAQGKGITQNKVSPMKSPPKSPVGRTRRKGLLTVKLILNTKSTAKKVTKDTPNKPTKRTTRSRR